MQTMTNGRKNGRKASSAEGRSPEAGGRARRSGDLGRRSRVLLCLPLLLACDGDARTDSGADAFAGDREPTGELVVTVSGLSGPEAVKYDADQDVYFVANFGPSADRQRDANGFISRVDAEGEIEDLRFITGTVGQPLHMPRGMTLVADTLWVADVDGIHAFHRRTGEAVAFVDFSSLEPGFLNDIDTDAAGTLHVTDTGRGRVYRVEGRTPVVAVEDDRTGPPNGITWDEERGAFLLAPWEGGQVIRAWTPDGGFSEVVTIPGGNFDGIEIVRGRIVVASQNDSTLWIVESGTPRPAARLGGQPADIGADVRRGRIAIPYISRNLVEIWHLPSLAADGPTEGR